MTLNEHYPKPLCKTSQQFKQTYEAFDQIMASFKKKECPCPPKCRDITSSIHFINTVQPLQVPNYTIVRYFPENEVLEEQEYWGYTSGAFICDLGGALGLFLGISILTLAEMLEFCILKIKRLIN